MERFEVTRRVALGVFSALAMAPIVFSRAALARHAAAARGIHVDVAPLMQNSGEPTAAWVARELPGALAQAGVVEPATVRVDYVILGPSSGGTLPLGASLDQIVGEAVVGGVARPVRASTSYYPSAVDQTLVERSNHDRVSQLVQALAYWVAREG
jgi:hypothetical protein